MNYQSNAAYDLSIYENKNTQEEIAEEVLESKPYLRVLPKKATVLAARIAVLKTSCALLSVVAIMSVIIYNRVILTEMGAEINSYKKMISKEVSENTRLSSALSSKVSIRNIEESALNMHLSKVDKFQITYVDLSEGDKVQRTSASPQMSLWDKIKISFDEFLAYIGIKTNIN